MHIEDCISLLDDMKKLNLGCGNNWKLYPEHAGLDIVDFGQEYSVDIFDFLKAKRDSRDKYHEIMANHFLEHFNPDELKVLFDGVYKLLKPNGIFKFVVPHMKKEKSWVLSHKTFWNEETVKWLEREDAQTVYGFGRWRVASLVVNERLDIHVVLVAQK